MKYEIQAMSKSGGVIVNTSSVAGHVGIADASTYIATKHAVEGLTKSVALEVATMGIRVNAVAPAATDTEMIARVVGSGESEARQNLTAMHPLGRIAKAEEIAQAVLFLASPASSFITGISLPVDGGYLAR